MTSRDHYKKTYVVGCRLYNDCFTCPLPDCVWHKVNKRLEDALVRRWMPVVEEKLRERVL